MVNTPDDLPVFKAQDFARISDPAQFGRNFTATLQRLNGPVEQTQQQKVSVADPQQFTMKTIDAHVGAMAAMLRTAAVQKGGYEPGMIVT